MTSLETGSKVGRTGSRTPSSRIIRTLRRSNRRST